jgi:hypothetical protein
MPEAAQRLVFGPRLPAPAASCRRVVSRAGLAERTGNGQGAPNGKLGKGVILASFAFICVICGSNFFGADETPLDPSPSHQSIAASSR